MTTEIQAFNLKIERFSRVRMPYKPQTSFICFNMAVLDGRLCLTFYNHNFYLRWKAKARQRQEKEEHVMRLLSLNP